MVSEIVTTFTTTITTLFSGIGTGVVDLFSKIVYDSTTGLTPLAEWMIVFMGFSFAVTIFYAIFKKVA